MSAERAWASAMAMKSVQSTENTQKKMAGSTKRQIVSRLNKATQYADHLISCVGEKATSHASDQDILELAAYRASLRGSLYFEKARWDSCIQQYSIARLIYTTLSSTARTDVFKDLLSATVDPSIRYAAYQLKYPRTKAVSDIAIERFPPEESDLRKQIENINPEAFVTCENSRIQGKTIAEDVPSTITWRQRIVKIEDAIIAQTMATANKIEQGLSKIYAKADGDTRQLATAYDDVINARQEAVDATKSAIDELMAEGVDSSDRRVQSLQLTRTAVSYAVIELRIGRNRVLCGPSDGASLDHTRSKRPRRLGQTGELQAAREESTSTKNARLRQRLVLYESILQNLDAVGDLSGVAGDSVFMEELSAKRAYFRALKYAS
jgi:signal recognition particle subunit SRP68